MPPTKATPMTVPINNPVTKQAVRSSMERPRPASQATKNADKDGGNHFEIDKLGNRRNLDFTGNQRTQYADGQQDDAQMQTVFFHQGKILRQGRLLHEQQYRRRNRNRVVVADDAQKNQRNQKQKGQS